MRRQGGGRGASGRPPAARGGLTLAALVLSATTAAAQSPLPPSVGVRRVEQWCKPSAAMYMTDFGELGRYRAANARLKSAPPQPNRVVFFGDSITDLWPLESFFPGKPYVNRGISGQTTSQMLVRFRQDVIDLHPKAVVILAGTNDIAGNTGPISAPDIEAQFTSFAELARANHVAVIFSSILPVHNYSPQARHVLAVRPPERIIELNRWLKDTAAAHGYVYLDYFSAMVDDAGLLKRELADDGLHPNDAGYAVMAPLAKTAIEQALGQAQATRAP